MLGKLSLYTSCQFCDTEHVEQAIRRSDVHKLALSLPVSVNDDPMKHAKESFVVNNSLPDHSKFNSRAINPVLVAALLEGILKEKKYLTVVNSPLYTDSDNPSIDKLLNAGATMLYDLLVPAKIINDNAYKDSDPTQTLHQQKDTGALSNKNFEFTSDDPVYSLSYCGNLPSQTLQNLSLLRWKSSFNWTGGSFKAAMNHVTFETWPRKNLYRPVFSQPCEIYDMLFAMGCDFGLSRQMGQVENEVLSSTAVWCVSDSIFNQDEKARSFEEKRKKAEQILTVLNEHLEEAIMEHRTAELVEQTKQHTAKVHERLSNTYLGESPDLLAFVGVGALARTLGVEHMVAAAESGVPLDEIY